MGRGTFWGGKGRPIVKYRDALPRVLQKMADPIEIPFEMLISVDQETM